MHSGVVCGSCALRTGPITHRGVRARDSTGRAGLPGAVGERDHLQGTVDTGNDPAWSDSTVEVFTAAGKSAEVITFDGANAVLDPSWEEAIVAIEAFLAESL
jgi:hypothetical protein